jgi:hypothetical protein
MGILAFTNLNQAFRAGYHLYERTEHGFIARMRTAGGWIYAAIVLN